MSYNSVADIIGISSFV